MNIRFWKSRFEKRAERGANLLDSILPEWMTMINVVLLDIRMCSRCILGQIYGNYERGCREVGIDRFDNSVFGKPVRNGFLIASDSVMSALKTNAAWKSELSKRRTAA